MEGWEESGGEPGNLEDWDGEGFSLLGYRHGDEPLQPPAKRRELRLEVELVWGGRRRQFDARGGKGVL